MVGLKGLGFGGFFGVTFRRCWLVNGVVLSRGIPAHRGLSGANKPSRH